MISPKFGVFSQIYIILRMNLPISQNLKRDSKIFEPPLTFPISSR